MEGIKDKVIESLLRSITYDEMTLEQERLVVQYETERWRLKVDELINSDMSKEAIEEQIHDWWLDYLMADGTEENLYNYVTSKF